MISTPARPPSGRGPLSPGTALGMANAAAMIGFALGVDDLVLSGVVASGLSACVLVLLARGGRGPLGVPWAFLGLWLGWVVLRGLTGSSPYLSLLEIGRVVPLATLAWMHAGDPRGRSALLVGLESGLGIALFFGCIELLTPSDLPGSWVDSARYQYLDQRLASVLVNPNLFGLYLSGLTVMMLGRVFTCPGPQFWIRVVWAALTTSLLVLTYSRGSWLGAGIGILHLIYRFSRDRQDVPEIRRRLLILTLLLLPVGAMAGRAVVERFQVSTDRAALGVNQRAELYKGVWALCRENILIGSGPHTFELLFPRHRTVGGYYPKDAHSDFLQILAETGVIGLVPIVLFVGFLLSSSASGPPTEHASSGLVAMVAAALLASTTRYFVTKVLLFSLVALATREAFSVGEEASAIPEGGPKASRVTVLLNRFVAAAVMALVVLGAWVWTWILVAGLSLNFESPALLDAACRAIPVADDLRYLRGRMRMGAGDREGYREALLECWRLNPLQSRYAADLASLLIEDRSVERAREWIDRALRLDPMSEENLFLSAKVSLLERDPGRAIDILQRALQTNPQYLTLNKETYPHIMRFLIELLDVTGASARARELEARYSILYGAPGLPH